MDTPARTASERAAVVVGRFLGDDLPLAEWTHEAHLAVCRALLDQVGDPAAVLALLRRLIMQHNRRVGVPPGHGGYHETVTAYYVLAVAHARPETLEGVLADPACSREAVARHWSAGCLASPQSRQRWVDPDLAPLPWPTD